MPTTELRTYGSNKLTDKQYQFVIEYVACFSGAKAAVAAGYPKRSAAAMAGKLLRNPKVKALVGKLRRQTVEKLEISREEAMRQLYYLATRSGADFVGEDGVLIENVNLLPRRAQEAIDGIEQEVTTYVDENGNETRKVKTRLRLVSKGKALEMAMKYLGLFAPEQVDITVQAFDWKRFTLGPNGDGKLVQGKVLQGKIASE